LILGNKSAAAGDYAAGVKFFEKAAGLRPGTPEIARQIAEWKSLAHSR